MGEELSQTTPSREKRYIHYKSEEPVLRLVIQVANFEAQRAGIIHGIKLGQTDEMNMKREVSLSIQIFLIGAMSIVSIYHIGQYLLRRKEKAPLYFGLFSFTIAIRGLFTGETVIYQFLPQLNWELALRAEYVTLWLSTLLFIFYLNHSYLTRHRSKALGITFLICSRYGLMSLFSPVLVLTYTLRYFVLFLLFAVIYTVYVFLLAAVRQWEGARISLSGAFFLILSIVNDILFNVAL